MSDFGAAESAALAREVAAALGVEVTAVSIAGLRAGSVVADVRVAGIADEATAKEV